MSATGAFATIILERLLDVVTVPDALASLRVRVSRRVGRPQSGGVCRP